jgi:hypothetical protein
MASNYEGSETGNWNIAENWSNEMIFKPFYEASQYLTIAKFGCSNIEEDFMFNDETKVKSRVRALNWAKDKLEQGIRQCLFAIRNQTDKDKVKAYLKEIVDLNEVMNMVEQKIVDRDTVKSLVNEEAFDLAYGVLNRIFTEVTEPMNKSDLIFNFREQFDPKEFKDKIRESFIEGD